jgi:Phage integrase family.
VRRDADISTQRFMWGSHTILSLVTFHKTCVRICEVALKPNSEQRRSGSWVALIGLDPAAYGTHSLRRTKATLIYRRTRNLRAVQLLLGHTKLESTVRYLGIEVDDVLEIAEQTEV